jgi:hypothetical protein
MDFQPVSSPLRDVLREALHANNFAYWRDDLYDWERAHPAESEKLRGQMAAAALTPIVDPDHLVRLSGHWVADAASTQAWFVDIFMARYGRAPTLDDIAAA